MEFTLGKLRWYWQSITSIEMLKRIFYVGDLLIVWIYLFHCSRYETGFKNFLQLNADGTGWNKRILVLNGLLFKIKTWDTSPFGLWGKLQLPCFRILACNGNAKIRGLELKAYRLTVFHSKEYVLNYQFQPSSFNSSIQFETLIPYNSEKLSLYECA